MIRVYTHFDHRRTKPLPLASAIYNNGTINIVVFYFPHTGDTLYEIEKRKRIFCQILSKSDKIKINDYKSHLSAFELGLDTQTEIFDYAPERNSIKFQDLNQCIEGIKSIVRSVSEKPKAWEKLIASSSIVYEFLERRGLFDGVRHVHPVYHFTTTGRSKVSEFNIQNELNPHIRLPSIEYDIFVHLDWVGADIRTAAFLSGDRELEESFIKSDPYTVMAEALFNPDDEEPITRDQCKIELLRSVYSLDTNSPFVGFYPDLMEWIKDTLDKIESNGFSESLLGRRFIYNGNNAKNVFNAIIQGTVAHAMQNVIVRLGTTVRDCIVTDIHDSLIVACNKSSLKYMIEHAVDIMCRPLNGLIDQDPFYPVRVSVGNQWRQWVYHYKDYRNE